ncbi:uncharacterized protein PHALS_04584 [Plasmopara halstedii]|uniref:Uncharacterized protein n=1 Tax=Plasmopara halstedii TaxID=4781 RepID=A0A0P1A8X7_PLAHL|nr:uncharacterized protein PHALS_04584 [Plasmopara halstedii]CEG37132.1 hypothetical protein PHALS_04584 [Plasmopara halstedii]|eukprot:XP_024573501.1 hypothetical protein PHALS_04584 [Plasmopara halstedii]
MTALLSWVNLVLYVIQLIVNGNAARYIGPMSRRYETLITPAPYAFSIWSFIYPLLAITVVVDCFWPSFSFYQSAPNANVMRALFAVSCLMNMGYLLFFTSEYVNFATVTIVILWSSLFVLYLHITAERRDADFNAKRYVLSELGIIVYFAWTSAAMVISFAVTFQYVAGDYLSLTTYLALLSLLSIGALYTVIFEGDIAFGLVAIWAFIGLAVKKTSLAEHIELIAMNVHACALQSAAILVAFIVISFARKLLDPTTQFLSLPLSAPLYGEKPLNYGTTHA